MSEEESGEDGAADGVPGATDGAGEHRERLGSEESAGKDGGQTSVLHAYLDRDGALLGSVETGQTTGCVAEDIAQRVVAEHYGEGPEEEHQSTGHEIVVDGRYDASHDACQTDDAQTGHQRLDDGETLALGVSVVEEAADAHRDDRYDEDVEEHADGINLDDLASRQLHEQGRHHRGEEGRGAGHTHGERHVAVTEIRHDIARHTARTATHQQDAQCQGWFQVEHMHQQIGHTGHDEELRTGTDEDIQRALGQDAEIVSGQRQSHRQHDDAKDNGLCGAAYPYEQVGHEECQYGDGCHEQRGVLCQPAAESLKGSYHLSFHFCAQSYK